MKENDFDFIKQVTEFYYSTVDGENKKGNISKVMEKFSISRTKALKILITSGAIDTPLHRDIMKLKEEGYDAEEIANTLNVSISTISANTPYEKVIYNGEEKSSGAVNVENFRNREKVFMDKVVRKPSDLEVMCNEYEKSTHAAFVREFFPNIQIDERKDDTPHLNPAFTAKECEMFKIRPNVTSLHIELNETVPEEYRELCGIKYGDTFTRDILVPDELPLHNLHYVINQAFGFTNSHMHEFQLDSEDLQWVTRGKVENWKKLIGLVFKNPIRDDEIDFWDDDYEGGSPRKWMRSKYTGPRYRKCYEETYRYILDEVKDLEVKADKLENLYGFRNNPFAVNEVLPLINILNLDRHYKMPIEEFYEELDDGISDASCFPITDHRAEPWIYGFAKKLFYTYDFGDNWHFTITPKFDVVDLLEKEIVTEKEVRDAIKKVCHLARPVIIAADGYPLVDDCNALQGYIETLSEIEEGNKEYKEWIESMGWKKVIDKNVL